MNLDVDFRVLQSREIGSGLFQRLSSKSVAIFDVMTKLSLQPAVNGTKDRMSRAFAKDCDDVGVDGHARSLPQVRSRHDSC